MMEIFLQYFAYIIQFILYILLLINTYSLIKFEINISPIYKDKKYFKVKFILVILAIIFTSVSLAIMIAISFFLFTDNLNN